VGILPILTSQPGKHRIFGRRGSAGRIFQRLRHADIHLLIDGIKYEMFVRCEAPKGDISPAFSSHPEILLYLDFDLSPDDPSYFEDSAGYLELDSAAWRLGSGAGVQYTAAQRQTNTSDGRHVIKIGTRSAVVKDVEYREHPPREIQLQSVSHSFNRPKMLFWDSDHATIHSRDQRKARRLAPLSSIRENVILITGYRNDQRGNPNDTSVFNTVSPEFDRRGSRGSKRSSFSEYRSFVTAFTHRTGSSSRFSFFSSQSRPSISGGTGDQRWSVQTFRSSPTYDPDVERSESSMPGARP
jgi:hypothetical protein